MVGGGVVVAAGVVVGGGVVGALLAGDVLVGAAGVVVGAGVVVAAPGGVKVNASRRTPFSRLATTSVCVPALRFSVGPLIHVHAVRALLGTLCTRVEPPSTA